MLRIAQVARAGPAGVITSLRRLFAEKRVNECSAIFPDNPSCGMIARYERFTMLWGAFSSKCPAVAICATLTSLEGRRKCLKPVESPI
jgi:hypothetical protein